MPHLLNCVYNGLKCLNVHVYASICVCVCLTDPKKRSRTSQNKRHTMTQYLIGCMFDGFDKTIVSVTAQGNANRSENTHSHTHSFPLVFVFMSSHLLLICISPPVFSISPPFLHQCCHLSCCLSLFLYLPLYGTRKYETVLARKSTTLVIYSNAKKTRMFTFC